MQVDLSCHIVDIIAVTHLDQHRRDHLIGIGAVVIDQLLDLRRLHELLDGVDVAVNRGVKLGTGALELTDNIHLSVKELDIIACRYLYQ